jgi:CRP/FNR family transcriptional regulator, cyclic AMP receptor protein
MMETALAGNIDLKPRICAPGTAVWGIGALPDCVHRLIAGRVDIVSIDSAGNELLLRTVLPGETFGEVCFCSHRTEPHDMIARAAVLSEIMEISYDEFCRRMRRDPNMMESVLNEFCVRLGDLEERAQILALHDATQRLRRLLVYLARSRGTKSRNRSEEFSLTISHSELASLSALSRPHVSLLMTQFRKRGWVSYRRGTPVRVHLERLVSR